MNSVTVELGPQMVSLEQISHAYTVGIPVLTDVTVAVDGGERVALLGESGAGKSTILRCINGLITPSAGAVNVLGASLRDLNATQRARVRRSIGMIFQQFNVHERLSVLDNVLVGRLGYTPPRRSNLKLFSAHDLQLAHACIREVGIEQFACTRVRNLSGGQKQRVGIARALAQQPQIILGDEPTANLDVRTAREILSLLKSINEQQGTTLILSMHDVELAREFCQRIVGIREGRIVYDGPAEKLNQEVMKKVFY